MKIKIKMIYMKSENHRLISVA